MNDNFFSGDREAVIARQEFIKQLSLWDSDEDDESQEEPKQVPLPGNTIFLQLNLIANESEQFLFWLTLELFRCMFWEW